MAARSDAPTFCVAPASEAAGCCAADSEPACCGRRETASGAAYVQRVRSMHGRHAALASISGHHAAPYGPHAHGMQPSLCSYAAHASHGMNVGMHAMHGRQATCKSCVAAGPGRQSVLHSRGASGVGTLYMPGVDSTPGLPVSIGGPHVLRCAGNDYDGPWVHAEAWGGRQAAGSSSRGRTILQGVELRRFHTWGLPQGTALRTWCHRGSERELPGSWRSLSSGPTHGRICSAVDLDSAGTQVWIAHFQDDTCAHCSPALVEPCRAS